MQIHWRFSLQFNFQAVTHQFRIQLQHFNSFENIFSFNWIMFRIGLAFSTSFQFLKLFYGYFINSASHLSSTTETLSRTCTCCIVHWVLHDFKNFRCKSIEDSVSNLIFKQLLINSEYISSISRIFENIFSFNWMMFAKDLHLQIVSNFLELFYSYFINSASHQLVQQLKLLPAPALAAFVHWVLAWFQEFPMPIHWRFSLQFNFQSVTHQFRIIQLPAFQNFENIFSFN